MPANAGFLFLCSFTCTRMSILFAYAVYALIGFYVGLMSVLLFDALFGD